MHEENDKSRFSYRAHRIPINSLLSLTIGQDKKLSRIYGDGITATVVVVVVVVMRMKIIISSTATILVTILVTILLVWY